LASTVALIDYGSGNLRSAEKALARAAAESGLDMDIAVTSDATRVAEAERIVLPGVGAFADCMRGVSGIAGMIEALETKVLKQGTPFLGICVGMQLLAGVGREHGDHKGLGWIDGEVVRMEPRSQEGERLKVPHMGWNSLQLLRPHPMLQAMPEGTDMYFVHSYVIRPSSPAHIVATTGYGGPIAAIVGRDNILGTQFHPEKSQAAGLTFLSRFLKWKP
jgi:imidazole glycerol-phosphate synthase subunit HisH